MEYLQSLFMPETDQARERVVANARGCIKWIHCMFSKMSNKPKEKESLGVGNMMEHAIDTGDLTYCQFLILMSIPQIGPLMNAVRKNVSDARMERFMHRLFYCRKNLFDGLTRKQQPCSRAILDVHFPNLRAFVEDMRLFYLMRSNSPKREVFQRSCAEWDNPYASNKAETGPLYFTIVSIILFANFLEDYSDFFISQTKPSILPTLVKNEADGSYTLTSPAAATTQQKSAKTAAAAAAVEGKGLVTTRFEPLPPTTTPSRPLTSGRDLIRGLDLANPTFFRIVTTISLVS